MSAHECRFCAAPLDFVVVDLGLSPPSNALVDAERAGEPESFYPLRPQACRRCWLVQLPQYQQPSEIFDRYPYFSSFSTTWLEHVRNFGHGARERFGLGADSLVVELASNDGHLLSVFRDAGVPVLGIEPARNVAAVAVAGGIQTVTSYFGERLARDLAADGRRADLVVANNVLAHVPDLNDFVAGIALLLKPAGVATLEFPHLARLLAATEFDTIYHEHFSYFSLACARRVFAAHDLRIFDIEELPTHGGSLRIYAARSGAGVEESQAVRRVLHAETEAGLESERPYREFARRVVASKHALVGFLTAAARSGKRVAGYGAPAKATTLLNYCGVRSDLVEFTVDRNPHKQGKLIPGVRIPIHSPEKIQERKPAYIVIFPWNIAHEISTQLAYTRAWGARLIVPLPTTAELT